MSIKVVLFDLDGTLLPMDQDHFIKTYLGMLSRRIAPYGYEPQAFLAAMWKATGAMIKNDGAKTNEEAFWTAFRAVVGDGITEHLGVFDTFYDEEFDLVAPIVARPTQAARELVLSLKARGFRVALATNPLFPSIATQKRMAWAGFSPEDFELYTTYENSTYSKPNLNYYADVAARLGVSPEECLMVGNDVSDDMVARELGMQVFLLTDCLINPKNADIEQFPHGDFSALTEFTLRLSL